MDQYYQMETEEIANNQQGQLLMIMDGDPLQSRLEGDCRDPLLSAEEQEWKIEQQRRVERAVQVQEQRGRMFEHTAMERCFDCYVITVILS